MTDTMNRCKLTECQGKPRCRTCLAMDAAYGPHTEPSHSMFDGGKLVPCALQRDDSHPQAGWLFIPHADGNWVSLCKLPAFSRAIVEHWLEAAEANARAALDAAPAPAEPPPDWAGEVEQRLLTWRQRLMNRSGDQLALDDFMDKESIDDLIDCVCAPIYDLAAPHEAQPQEPPDGADWQPTPDYLDGHRDGLAWAADLFEMCDPRTGDWSHDDRHELGDAIRRGPEMPPSAQPVAPAALTDDTRRLDWLSQQHVTVRIPMRYGSRHSFAGSPDIEDVDWNLRAAIDRRAATTGAQPAGE